MAQSGTVEEQPKLKRVMGPGLLLLFVVGDILGTGVYALTGQVAGEVGGAAWLPFLIAFLIATVTAFSYLELVTKYPQAAGAALYAHKAFGIHFLTFLVTFVVMCSGITSASTASQAFASNLIRGFGLDWGKVGIAVVALAFMASLAAINLRGVSESVKLNVVLTIVEVTGLVTVILVGFWAFTQGGDNLDFSRIILFESESERSTFVAVTAATSLAFFAMVGFEDSVNMAEETKDPVKIFPKVLLTGLSIAGVVYILVSIIAVALVPIGDLRESTTPLVDVVEAAAPGLPIDAIFPFITMFAVSNTALINMLMASRLIYGMARQHVLPPVLGTVHPRRHTPWVAIVFTTRDRLRPDLLRVRLRQQQCGLDPRRHHVAAAAHGVRRGQRGGTGVASGCTGRREALQNADRATDHRVRHLVVFGDAAIGPARAAVPGGGNSHPDRNRAVLHHHADQQANGPQGSRSDRPGAPGRHPGLAEFVAAHF